MQKRECLLAVRKKKNEDKYQRNNGAKNYSHNCRATKPVPIFMILV